MANSLSYASIFQEGLDEQMLQGLTSRGMEAQASQVKYTGGSTIKVRKMSMTGLGDYSRSGGYPSSGAVTVEWEDHTFDKDRGQEFQLDSMDSDEAMTEAGEVMSEFQRTEVIPEVDAYRYSKIWSYALAGDKVKNYDPLASTVLAQLTSDIEAMQDVIGEDEQLRIYMGYSAANVLSNATGVEKRINVEEFNDGGVNTKVKMIDGIPIIRVPSVRFKTEYTFSATDGFTATATAASINWVIVAERAVIAIVKQDKPRMFDPDTNQSADAWLIQYRKYHTLIIPDNKVDGIYVNYTGIDAPELTATVAGGSASGTTKFTATAGTGNTLGYILGGASPEADYLDVIADFTGAVEPYTSGADIEATADQVLTMCKVNSSGRIIEAKEVTLASGDITA